MLIQVIFYMLATTLVVSALFVVTARNTVHSAMYLILTFFTTAALWITLHAEFLALVLVLVYVGAVMVLFLFVLMMLNLNQQKIREGFIKYLPLGIMVGVLVAAEMIIIITRGFGSFTASPDLAAQLPASNTAALGSVLYTQYLFAFEAAAVLLLIAMIAAIVLTLFHSKVAKKQNPADQVRVRKEDRIRIIQMDSEKKQTSVKGGSS